MSPFFAGTGGQGEGVSSGESIAVSPQTGPRTDGGTTSDEVPAPLKKLFEEADDATDTSTPASLLAAISHQECGRLWTYTEKNLQIVQTIIDNNDDVAHVPVGLGDAKSRVHPNSWGCGFKNDSNVWGPMQFLDTTWGIASGADATTHPIPRAVGYGAKASQFTNRAPAFANQPVVSMLSIKDSVYGASIMLYENASQPTVWTEATVKKTAARYYGSCEGEHASYCQNIVSKWRRYAPQFEGDTP